jgi:hypothetical protein
MVVFAGVIEYFLFFVMPRYKHGLGAESVPNRSQGVLVAGLESEGKI